MNSDQTAYLQSKILMIQKELNDLKDACNNPMININQLENKVSVSSSRINVPKKIPHHLIPERLLNQLNLVGPNSSKEYKRDYIAQCIDQYFFFNNRWVDMTIEEYENILGLCSNDAKCLDIVRSRYILLNNNDPEFQAQRKQLMPYQITMQIINTVILPNLITKPIVEVRLGTDITTYSNDADGLDKLLTDLIMFGYIGQQSLVPGANATYNLKAEGPNSRLYDKLVNYCEKAKLRSSFTATMYRRMIETVFDFSAARPFIYEQIPTEIASEIGAVVFEEKPTTFITKGWLNELVENVLPGKDIPSQGKGANRKFEIGLLGNFLPLEFFSSKEPRNRKQIVDLIIANGNTISA